MSTEYLFESLKAHYRMRGLKYRDVAKAIGVSEVTIKRVFSEKNCTLDRLEELCGVVELDIAELARGAPRRARLLTKLTREQEQEIVDDVRLFVVAVCTMMSMRFEDIIDAYGLSEAEVVARLARLDRIRFIELLPGNRYRPLVARTFQWIPNGPIMQWTKHRAAEFFDYPFDGDGEMLRVVNLRISAAARLALSSRLEQVALEYEEQHNADANLPWEQRLPVSLCLAVRPWEPAEFRALRHNGPGSSNPRKAAPTGVRTVRRMGR